MITKNLIKFKKVQQILKIQKILRNRKSGNDILGYRLIMYKVNLILSEKSLIAYILANTIFFKKNLKTSICR